MVLLVTGAHTTDFEHVSLVRSTDTRVRVSVVVGKALGLSSLYECESLGPQVRQQQLGAVLEHVRLPLLPQDVLVTRAAAEPLVSAGIRVKVTL